MPKTVSRQNAYAMRYVPDLCACKICIRIRNNQAARGMRHGNDAADWNSDQEDAFLLFLIMNQSKQSQQAQVNFN